MQELLYGNAPVSYDGNAAATDVYTIQLVLMMRVMGLCFRFCAGLLFTIQGPIASRSEAYCQVAYAKTLSRYSYRRCLEIDEG